MIGHAKSCLDSSQFASFRKVIRSARLRGLPQTLKDRRLVLKTRHLLGTAGSLPCFCHGRPELNSIFTRTRQKN